MFEDGSLENIVGLSCNEDSRNHPPSSAVDDFSLQRELVQFGRQLSILVKTARAVAAHFCEADLKSVHYLHTIPLWRL